MRGRRNISLDEGNLGLAISGAKLEQAPELTLHYGKNRTEAEIAAFMGISTGGVWMIEQRALRKLKKAIFMRKDPLLAELIEQVTGKRLV